MPCDTCFYKLKESQDLSWLETYTKGKVLACLIILYKEQSCDTLQFAIMSVTKLKGATAGRPIVSRYLPASDYNGMMTAIHH